ncbi:MAG: ABC transporter permease [Prolixibacteraceae bacterium]|jgi:putative ABC transport system permease protein|nr:ABC transporter permease [Prolixibacteraceae bacterium]
MKIRAFYTRYSYNVQIAIEAIIANKVKSLLTALGIIFGVAAVISMLAIGNGAEQEILEQIKMVGVNNIIVTPILQADQASSNDAKAGSATESNQLSGGKKKFSKGLTLNDAASIKQIISTVQDVCPIITFNYTAILHDISSPVKLDGTDNTYFRLFDIKLESGTFFHEQHTTEGYPVCIIGYNVKNLFFNHESPIGKYIKCGQIWLQVIGVIERRNFVGSGGGTMSISSTDNSVIIPVKTMLLRYRNRALIRGDQVKMVSSGRDNTPNKVEDTNQLDKLIVRVKETQQLTATAKVVGNMLMRKHNDIHDVDVSIPELLLKQQQKTKNIFNIVLGAIAGISLIVGGIGIMNIMLASVMERIREIGTRQAIGASRKDIVFQFLSESTLISLAGGLIGVILGVILSKIIQTVFDIKTIISLFSIFISFGVSVFIGITFGYLPAKKAADKDPVESLRQ